jgi:hypothetical protein
LPIGEQAQFRLEKDKMRLRVEDGDDKEREYLVVSMSPNDGTVQSEPANGSSESSHLTKANTK